MIIDQCCWWTLEKTLCHERPLFTKQLGWVLQKLFLGHLGKYNMAMFTVQLLTCPWGHIFMNPLYCSLISAALSEVFFPSAANIAPSSASFLLFLPGILLQRCQLLGFSRSLHSRRVYHYLGDGSYPLKDEVLHCRKRFHRMSRGLRVTQPSSTECWLFWLRHHGRTALAIINLFCWVNINRYLSVPCYVSEIYFGYSGFVIGDKILLQCSGAERFMVLGLESD